MLIQDIELKIDHNIDDIKSRIRQYSVTFSNISVIDILSKNDFLFIDKNVDNVDFKNKWSFDAREENKNIFSSMDLIRRLDEIQFKKTSKLIVVGGGITQDVATVAACLYKRGIDWIFFPTTLLSMCDSCIGSKCGLNYENGKNQLGVFYPPKSVYINVNYLDTLNKNDIMSGMGEILKLYQIGGITFNHEDSIETMIKNALAVKKVIIEYDEFENNIRKSLNYGHSFGHVIEVLSDYQIPHGTSVILGMLLINEYFGIVDVKFTNDCKRYLQNEYNLSLNNFKKILLKDKKISNNSITLIKTEFGKTSFVNVEINDDFVTKITSSLLKILDQLR